MKSEDEVDLSFSKSELFAVRSSFSGEDGSLHSYAGQFTTLLNVRRRDVINAVRTVMDDSGWNAEDYQTAMKAEKEGKMYVVIQEMIEAEWSGVIFTSNPQGLLNEVVLTAGAGTGNGVVEDRVETTTYYYNKCDGQSYFETQEGAFIPPAETVKKVIAQGERIAELFDRPMDIEFAVKGGKIFFLQARPITTLNCRAEQIVLDNSNIVESYPGVSLPATQSFAREVYYRVFRSCVTMISKSEKTAEKMDHILRNMVDTANGRIYYRISNWYGLLRLLPFSGKVIRVWQEMLGVMDKQISGSSEVKISIFTKLRVACSFFSILISTPRKMEHLNHYFSEHLPEYRKRLDMAETEEQLLKLYDELQQELGGKWGITLANDLYAFVYTALAKRRHAGEIRKIRELESMKPVLVLEKILEKVAQEGIDNKDYITMRADYIEEYGDRSLEELKLEAKTMRTNPELFDRYVEVQMFSEAAASREPEQKAGEGYVPKLQSVPGKVGNREAWSVRKAKQGIYHREISRMNRSRIFGIAREILLKIGTRLKDRGCIKDVRDIFWLYLEEIRECSVSMKCMVKLIEERKVQYKKFEKLPAYGRLVFEGKVFDKSPLNINNESFSGVKEILQGTPCSGGVVRGKVLIVENATMDLDTTGKILVTTTTDPGWVFLIKNSLGVIAEKGSLLSHTAIVTRELKKPSVVSAVGAMNYLKTGDMVELNGNTGTIRKIEEWT